MAGIPRLENRSWDGTGEEAMTERTKTLRPKNHDAQVAKSISPYFGVGCGQLVFHKGGKLISIEGDRGSPVSRGRSFGWVKAGSVSARDWRLQEP
jgi:formate dehydrogenase major subunit